MQRHLRRHRFRRGSGIRGTWNIGGELARYVLRRRVRSGRQPRYRIGQYTPAMSTAPARNIPADGLPNFTRFCTVSVSAVSVRARDVEIELAGAALLRRLMKPTQFVRPVRCRVRRGMFAFDVDDAELILRGACPAPPPCETKSRLHCCSAALPSLGRAFCRVDLGSGVSGQGEFAALGSAAAATLKFGSVTVPTRMLRARTRLRHPQRSAAESTPRWRHPMQSC